MTDDIDTETTEEAIEQDPRGRRARGPNEKWLIEKAMELTAPDIKRLLGEPPLTSDKLEALDREKLNGEDVAILGLWICLYDIFAMMKAKPASKCGWCLRAAPDDTARAALPDLGDDDGVQAHVLSCEHNPLVALAVAAVRWRREKYADVTSGRGDHVIIRDSTVVQKALDLEATGFLTTALARKEE